MLALLLSRLFEIPVDVFSPIEYPGTSGTPGPLHFPDGVPLQLAPNSNVDVQHGWKGAVQWVFDAIRADNKVAPVEVNWKLIIDSLLTAVNRQSQLLASIYTTLTFYIANTFNALNTRIGAYVTAIEDQLYRGDAANESLTFDRALGLQQQISELRATVFAGGLGIEAQIQAQIQQALALIEQTWIIPLTENLGHIATELQAETVNRTAVDTQIVTEQIPQAIRDVAAFLAPAIDAGVLALPIARAVRTWVDECGQPMCDTAGPNTDLGRLLKGLQLAALLALLRELMGADYNDVESAVVDIGRRMIGVVRTFETLFVEGGETIGETVLGFGA